MAATLFGGPVAALPTPVSTAFNPQGPFPRFMRRFENSTLTTTARGSDCAVSSISLQQPARTPLTACRRSSTASRHAAQMATTVAVSPAAKRPFATATTGCSISTVSQKPLPHRPALERWAFQTGTPTSVRGFTRHAQHRRAPS